MEVLSLIKNSLQQPQQQQQTTTDGAATLPSSSNPITKHFRLIRQTSCAGQEMVWKIYDAVRLADGKVCLMSKSRLLCKGHLCTVYSV